MQLEYIDLYALRDIVITHGVALTSCFVKWSSLDYLSAFIK